MERRAAKRGEPERRGEAKEAKAIESEQETLESDAGEERGGHTSTEPARSEGAGESSEGEASEGSRRPLVLRQRVPTPRGTVVDSKWKDKAMREETGRRPAAVRPEGKASAGPVAESAGQRRPKTAKLATPVAAPEEPKKARRAPEGADTDVDKTLQGDELRKMVEKWQGKQACMLTMRQSHAACISC